MKKTKRKNVILLLITAAIWGVAFVAQREGGKTTGPYLFCALRFFLGALVLIPAIKLLDYYKLTDGKPADRQQRKLLWLGGSICGILLAGYTMLQQLGLYLGATAGKAGFLTSCYIVLVPVLGLFLKRKCGMNVWIAVGLTLCGLYLLCMKGSLRMELPDILILICSFLCAIYILVVDYFTVRVDGVRMSCIQFLVAGIVALFPAVIVDLVLNQDGISTFVKALHSSSFWIAFLYTGILSSGVAYTFQIIGQKNMNPTVASLLMSLESVFSAIAGWAILGEQMGRRELAGCILIFAAVVLSQLRWKTDID